MALFGATAGVYLAVRFGGVALERSLPELTPKAFAALLYPLLALGLPLVTAALARRTEPLAGFVAAGSGLGTALVIEFAALGLALLPVSVALHRVAAVVALGIVAVGAARRADGERDGWLLAGGVGWSAILALPLFGLL